MRPDLWDAAWDKVEGSDSIVFNLTSVAPRIRFKPMWENWHRNDQLTGQITVVTVDSSSVHKRHVFGNSLDAFHRNELMQAMYLIMCSTMTAQLCLLFSETDWCHTLVTNGEKTKTNKKMKYKATGSLAKTLSKPSCCKCEAKKVWICLN